MQQAVIVRTARHPFVEVLALKDFSLLCLGDIVSSLGDQFTYIAMALLVLKTTGSAMQVGIMLIMTAVPNILLGLIAGVFVDRWDRRRTMIVCDLLRGGVIAAIPWLIHIHLALAYTAIFISTAADRFESSARVASIPHLVPKERMVSANAFKSTGVQAGQMIGFSLAGLMVGLYGTTVAFYFDAATFLLSALALLPVVIPYVPKPKGSGRSVGQVKSDLALGLRYIWQTTTLRAAMPFAFIMPFGISLLNALMVVFALRVLLTNEFGYGLLEASPAVGIVLSGIVIGSIGNNFRRSRMMGFGLATMGLGTCLLAFSMSLGVALVIMALVGVANGIMIVGMRTMLQEQASSEYRGRVSGAWNTASSTGTLLGMSLVGLADVIPVQLVLIVAALVMIVGGLVVSYLPALRKV